MNKIRTHQNAAYYFFFYIIFLFREIKVKDNIKITINIKVIGVSTVNGALKLNYNYLIVKKNFTTTHR